MEFVLTAVVLAAILAAVVVLLAALLPGWVHYAVEIDAPVSAVWAYGSDSRRAAEWSVFFHHITPDESGARPPDGQVGAFRRCFRDADEVEKTWDETTEEIVHERFRRIRTFNLIGFPFGFIARAQEYDVFQDYEPIDEDRTRLTFRSRLHRRPGLGMLLIWPIVKGMYVLVGAPAGQEVFVVNLENIKAAVEAQHRGVAYVRPHPYALVLPFEATPLRWWLRNRFRRVTIGRGAHQLGAPAALASATP